MDSFHIDGSQGEGGGQVLRTALSLSVLMQRPLHVTRIRAGRNKPGLMRQHLASVKAAQAISAADVEGASLGSTELCFVPHALAAGSHHIDIGSAGSTGLVLQTILPPLLRADGESRVAITGGTHNPLAPSTDFLTRSFLPLLTAMGAKVRLDVEKHGLFPAGGGRIVAHITPVSLQPLHLHERGKQIAMGADALLASVPAHVGTRELAVVGETFPQTATNRELHDLGGSTGPGNVLSLWAQFEQVAEVVTMHGERGISAETVAERACAAMARHLDSGAAVGPHLADQLLLPMWLAGGGSFSTMSEHGHLRTNAELIAAMTGARIAIERREDVVAVEIIC